MRKLILFTAVVALMVACGSKNQFTISGTIEPTTEGNIVLYAFEKGQPVPTDTTEIVDGKFKFTGEIEMPTLRLLGLEGTNNFLAQAFIESGKIKMTIYPDSFEANVIEGSNSQDLFQTYLDEMNAFSKKEGEIRNRFQQAQMSGNETEMEAVRNEYGVMADNNLLFAKNFISKNNASPVAAYVYLMSMFSQAESEELDSILTVFDPKIAESEFVKVIKDRADELRATAVGASAPDFSLPDMNGAALSLSSFKGKYVLIDFWASWCQPCMMELPNVLEQYAAFKDKGFEIIGISLDRQEEPWRAAIADNKMTWPQAWDLAQGRQGEVADLYGVTSIPHMVLVDKEGKIIAKNLRGEALKAKLAELMN
jgi:peroxiredoxin